MSKAVNLADDDYDMDVTKNVNLAVSALEDAIRATEDAVEKVEADLAKQKLNNVNTVASPKYVVEDEWSEEDEKDELPPLPVYKPKPAAPPLSAEEEARLRIASYDDEDTGWVMATPTVTVSDVLKRKVQIQAKQEQEARAAKELQERKRLEQERIREMLKAQRRPITNAEMDYEVEKAKYNNSSSSSSSSDCDAGRSRGSLDPVKFDALCKLYRPKEKKKRPASPKESLTRGGADRNDPQNRLTNINQMPPLSYLSKFKAAYVDSTGCKYYQMADIPFCKEFMDLKVDREHLQGKEKYFFVRALPRGATDAYTDMALRMGDKITLQGVRDSEVIYNVVVWEAGAMGGRKTQFVWVRE